jgi:predicted phosphate transport protein (TIGR00153 family)
MRSILPKDDLFFDNCEHICQKMVEAAEALKVMISEWKSLDMHAGKIKSLETESDEFVHQTVEHLHKTFVTPLDRQDILRLSSRLDDIVDLIEATSTRIRLYKPRTRCPEVVELAEVVLQSTYQVRGLVGMLRQMKKKVPQMKAASMEIDRLENAADEIRRKAIARLFEEESDPKELIKWKDIIEHIEGSTDRCEDVSDIIEGILLEHS